MKKHWLDILIILLNEQKYLKSDTIMTKALKIKTSQRGPLFLINDYTFTGISIIIYILLGV